MQGTSAFIVDVSQHASCSDCKHTAVLIWICAAMLCCVVQNIDRLCCGMMFDSRGAKRAAGLKVAESETELLLASQMGKLPVGE